MRQDLELRARLVRATNGLVFDPERSLRQFHGSRSRRVAARRVATATAAVVVAILGLSLAWIARPSGSTRHGPVAPPGPTGTIAYMQVTGAGDEAAVYAAPVEGGPSAPIGTETFSVYPVWSPDGTRVAYGAGADYDSASLTVTDEDGGAARQIVHAGIRGTLSWSPDGTRIAYIRDEEGITGAYVVGADGTNDTLVIEGSWQSVSWSPDGVHLLLAGHPATKEGIVGPEGFDVYTVRTDGTGLARLIKTVGFEHFASWSPDGARILFTRSDEYDDATYAQDVYVMDADGSNEQRLTSWSGFDSFPVWSPDGSWIAFASDRDATPAEQDANRTEDAFANISLYVMRSDGSDIQRVFPATEGQTLLPGSWKD